MGAHSVKGALTLIFSNISTSLDGWIAAPNPRKPFCFEFRSASVIVNWRCTALVEMRGVAMIRDQFLIHLEGLATFALGLEHAPVAEFRLSAGVGPRIIQLIDL